MAIAEGKKRVQVTLDEEILKLLDVIVKNRNDMNRLDDEPEPIVYRSDIIQEIILSKYPSPGREINRLKF